MATKELVARTGNEAMAEAMRQINPDVVAAYPITPATEIVQLFSAYVADGLVDTEFVTVESEHSAMSACVGASTAGARVMTGTSSQGLILMAEILYIAAGLRCPIVLAEVNRALSSPINIHCDHSDTMSVRDSGWIQIFSENSQEAYDNMIQAVRIAEHMDVRLPVMVTTDGFIISHGLEAISLLEDKEVQDFIGPYKAAYSLLDVEKPITVGGLDFTDFYFEHRRQTAEAMQNAKKVILDVGREFGEKFGRSYGFFEGYKLEDAEIALVLLGSTAGTARVAVDQLRAAGVKCGLLKLRVFRPFPAAELAEALKHLKAIAVMDRSDSLSTAGGPLFTDVRSALYDLPERPAIVNYIYGLGGRDITVEDLEGIYRELQRISGGGQVQETIQYLGVRE
ncbi:MAG: pyruvate ferredoxin oxidoreductase [Firmicutes bacterium]|nr:pyruvate ferredoxin oxidoreductase [Bacillota bacterium]